MKPSTAGMPHARDHVTTRLHTIEQSWMSTRPSALRSSCLTTAPPTLRQLKLTKP
eukprot:CAMPEP_0202868968 /NCGR_PEP_ID=MMETSP1391-20130828/11479_1 /ASSEMBLY_ACC=CAM_ASM_000867 /TAXON_ID=1034604 /ORGANISM="Chlamydomonas leiostraca, Strain SAG 11-49" /LENGTH=54 /DNA_ID=CAMNT_0049549201 /DNA_START=290 /DNA_END=457 /DNA_ORIENTATION=-